MSWLYGSSSKLDMEAVEREYTMVNELFQRVQKSCRTKCIPTQYTQPEITKGESTCIDRCVQKYIQTATKIAVESRGPQ
ncbi:protein transporter tim10 [Entomophthora muscae]|uniref:Protein transporter tim10 n=2 Tax=Entomophthora muscae TaxID=34485 RepID=A0ACC2S247_9FUNG|nr:protein transporter tim10 [Entomophthora muscae]KAJ9062479.1 protein transporter tim10 [Entomophthora muscae]